MSLPAYLQTEHLPPDHGWAVTGGFLVLAPAALPATAVTGGAGDSGRAVSRPAAVRARQLRGRRQRW
jgi:hypothetical protein